MKIHIHCYYDVIGTMVPVLYDGKCQERQGEILERRFDGIQMAAVKGKVKCCTCGKIKTKYSYEIGHFSGKVFITGLSGINQWPETSIEKHVREQAEASIILKDIDLEEK